MASSSTDYVSSVWRDGIFDNRVVFVTGGAGTICSAQTRALIKLGANACIIGRNPEKTKRMARDLEMARKGAKVIGIGGCDVRKVEHLEAAAQQCVKELGSLDFVIAGAAGNFVVPISAMSANAFKSVMDIDVLGTFNTVKATMPFLVESASRNPNPSSNGSTGGRFLAVSATFHYTGMPMQAHVSAAKAGVDSLIASLSLEYGPLGVTANAIAPGPIAGTEGMERLAGDMAVSEEGRRGIPSGRWGTVKDIADATVFLFSDAGNYVNGQIVPVDGASWRRQGSDGAGVGVDKGMKYPDYVIKGSISKQIRKGRKDSKL